MIAERSNRGVAFLNDLPPINLKGLSWLESPLASKREKPKGQTFFGLFLH